MGNRIAEFYTSKGNFKIELFEDKAPKTTENFIKLVNQGFYNGLIFHRVIEKFMIKDYVLCNVTVDAADGKLLSFLKANTDVVHSNVDHTMIHLCLFMDQKFYGRLKKYYPHLLTT